MFVLPLMVALMASQFVQDSDGSIISNALWHLPATIEVLRDVPVEVEPRYDQPQRRGVLYVSPLNEPPFEIRKGERFEMLRLYPESPSCRIRFKDKTYEVGTCYWLDGVRDQQTDIYRVISGHVDQTKK